MYANLIHGLRVLFDRLYSSFLILFYVFYQENLLNNRKMLLYGLEYDILCKHKYV